MTRKGYSGDYLKSQNVYDSTRSFRMEELQHIKVTEGEREVDLLTYLKGVEL